MSRILTYLLFLISHGIFAQITGDYKLVDAHALNAPKNLNKDIVRLVDYLSAPAENDFEIARAFFVWIGKNIEYDYDAASDSEMYYNYKVGEILKRKKAVCSGFSNLFRQMCQLKGLEAEVISGYSKGTITSKEYPVEPDHAWNAVRLAGKWYLLDVTWGAGLSSYEKGKKDKVHEDYFLPAPEQFILDHFPAMPMWQLLTCPITIAHFGYSPKAILKDSLPDMNCFSFEDSIDFYKSLPVINRRLAEAKTTYRYHPTKENAFQLAHSHLDHAASLVDSSEQFVAIHDINKLIDLQEQILADCRKADEVIELHTWQKEMYIHTLINHTAALFNNTDLNSVQDQSFYVDLLKNLILARTILNSAEQTYFTRVASRQCDEFVDLISGYLKKD